MMEKGSSHIFPIDTLDSHIGTQQIKGGYYDTPVTLFEQESKMYVKIQPHIMPITMSQALSHYKEHQ